MKKFNTKKPFHTKQLLFYSIVFFVIHFPLNYFISFATDIRRSVTSDLIGSFVFSIIMGLIFSYFAKPKYHKLDEAVSSKLNKGEKILIESIAGLQHGFIVFPGKLYLTNQHLYLAKHKAFQSPTIKTIDRSHITNAQAMKTYNLFNNGIEIKETSGKKHKLSLNNRDEVLNAYQKEI